MTCIITLERFLTKKVFKGDVLGRVVLRNLLKRKSHVDRRVRV